VPRGGKMDMPDARATEAAIIRHLANSYSYSLVQFEQSLKVIKTYYQLIGRKRASDKIMRHIRYLTSSKEALVRKIDEFFTKSESWGWIKNSYRGLAQLTDERKANFIKSKFSLFRYDKFVDERIGQLNRIVSLLSGRELYTVEKRKRVQPQTMLILVWILAFRHAGASNRKSVRETYRLVGWFSANRQPLLREFCNQTIHLGENAFRRYSERYIVNPKPSTRVYAEMAELLYTYSFLDYE
jgi:hypothetical protein